MARLTDKQYEVKQRYTMGESIRQIAKAMSLSPTRVHQIAVSAGVKRRAVGSGKKVK